MTEGMSAHKSLKVFDALIVAGCSAPASLCVGVFVGLGVAVDADVVVAGATRLVLHLVMTALHPAQH